MQKATKTWFVCTALALLAIACGWVFPLSSESTISFEKAAAAVRNGVYDHVVPFFSSQSAATRIAELEAEVAELKVRSLQFDELVAENTDLRKSASLAPRTTYHPEKCTIVSRGGSTGWWRMFTIDKGGSHGIAVGDAVVSPDGLVGRVKSVSATAAEVMPLTDPNCRVACRVQRDGAAPVRGILYGSGWRPPAPGACEFLYVADPLRMDFMKRDMPADFEGAPVSTSGLGGSLPAGIHIGRLTRTQVDDEGLYRSGAVVPAVNFAGLRVVYVLTTGTGGR